MPSIDLSSNKIWASTLAKAIMDLPDGCVIDVSYWDDGLLLAKHLPTNTEYEIAKAF